MKKHEIKKENQNKVTLLRHFPLPQNAAMDEASVAVRFTGLTLPEDLKVNKREKQETEDGVVVHYEFKNTPFLVSYELEANYDPRQQIDVAGNLRVRGEEGPSREEKDVWLQHAREEQARLQNTPNGEKLLRPYNDHQYTYNKAFDSFAFCDEWREGNMVEAMARDTHEALLQEDKIINDKDKNYAPSGQDSATYNGRSFYVQGALVLTLHSMKGGTSYLNPPGPVQIPDSEIQDSIEAINDFENAIYDNTENSEDNTKPMTKGDVYAVVADPEDKFKRPGPKKNSCDEYNYYMARLENERNGVVNNEEDKYGREGFFRKLIAEKEQFGRNGTVLHTGTFAGSIPGDGFEMDILLRKENGETKGITVLQVKTPEFDIDVDSEKWAQEFRAELEAKMQDVSFVGQSVLSVVRDGIGQIVRKEVAKYEAINI